MATAFSRHGTVARERRRSAPGGILRWALIADEVLLGLSAVGGGIGLIVTDGLGIPRSELAHSPFDRFTIPGLLLTGVGGGLLAAAWTVWRRRRLAPLASLAAGGVLLGWIVIEAMMVRSGRELQVAIFGASVLTIVLAGLRYRNSTT